MRAMYMQSAKVYNKEEFWFVDYIDSNYELLPAVGIFKQKEDAEKAAKAWTEASNMENMGQVSW